MRRAFSAFAIATAVTVGTLFTLPNAEVGQGRHSRGAIMSSDFYVTTADNFSIHVNRKSGPHPSKIPILLVHPTAADARVWDFPGRSLMDYLAVRGYDVYALDLRGMGTSTHPDSYLGIDIPSRVQDAAAAASYIVEHTGRAPVVIGWSQGGLVTGLLAATAPQLVAGVGLLGVAPEGSLIDPDVLAFLEYQLSQGVDRFNPPPDQLYAILFSYDPITGKPTISADAFAMFVSIASEPDSLVAILQLFSADFFSTYMEPAWPAIHVPALILHGALDAIVPADGPQRLYDALGSTQKQVIVFPRNAHGFSVEDNYHAIWRAFDIFLAQF
jgi:pimeloyl-ACP methyl ester carboxylesterase